MIAYSHDIFQMQKFGGVSRCIYEIARAVAVMRDVSIFSGSTANSYLLDGLANGQFKGKFVGNITNNVSGRFFGSLRFETAFVNWLRRQQRPIVHRSYYPPFDLVPNSLPVVETLHDMVWEKLDNMNSIKVRINSVIKRRALERADLIVCVSYHTLNDLVDVWPHLAPKAVVIHHGVSRISNLVTECTEDRPFFLYVGSREYRKNFNIILDALNTSEVLREVNLICVGGGIFSKTELSEFEKRRLLGRVQQKNLNDAALAGYFEKALALVYPSRYEGFGMPILEAMIHNCVVICSKASCLPEVGGDSVLYCSPNSAEEWGVTMERLVIESGLSVHLRSLGARRAQQFTWEEAGMKYLAQYDRLCV